MSGGISVASVASYAALAGAAVSAFSMIQQGKAQREAGDQAAAMGDYQKRQAEADASVQASEAQLQARQIRAAGERQRSSARAAQASGGVVLGAGTAEIIDKEINSNAEEDALASIYQGDVRANQIRQGGAISEYNGLAAQVKGKNAQTASYINAGASALSVVGQASKGWGSSASSGDGLSQGDRRKIGVY